MRKLLLISVLALLAALSGLAQDAPATPAPAQPAPAAAAPAPAAKPAPAITDSQRFKVKSLEAQFYQLQNQITQAQTAQLASQAAQEKMVPIRTELQKHYADMQASCAKDQTFQDETLSCVGKAPEAPAVAPAKPPAKK